MTGPSLDPLSPEVIYVLKPNIAFPGNSAQATAAETAAQSRLNDAMSPVTVTVAAGTLSGKLAR